MRVEKGTVIRLVVGLALLVFLVPRLARQFNVFPRETALLGGLFLLFMGTVLFVIRRRPASPLASRPCPGFAARLDSVIQLLLVLMGLGLIAWAFTL